MNGFFCVLICRLMKQIIWIWVIPMCQYLIMNYTHTSTIWWCESLQDELFSDVTAHHRRCFMFKFNTIHRLVLNLETECDLETEPRKQVILRTPQDNNFRFGTNVPLDSQMSWIDLGGQRSKVKVTVVSQTFATWTWNLKSVSRTQHVFS